MTNGINFGKGLIWVSKRVIAISVFIMFSGCGEENNDPTITHVEVANALVENVSADKLIETIGSYSIGTGGISIDASGMLYIADFGTSLKDIHGSKILKVDPKNGKSEVFSSGFDGATGNDFDSKGFLYQASFSTGMLYRIATTGEAKVFADGFKNPIGVVVDLKNNIYVTNCGGGSVAKVTPAGEVSTFATSELFKCANGITIDNVTGNIYVSNFGDANVMAVTPEGNVSLLATLPGEGIAHLTFANNTLYVAANSANQVYRVTLDGTFELYVGNGESTNSDGSLHSSSIKVPNDLTFSPDGSLYIYAVDNSGETQHFAPSTIRVIRNAIPRSQQ
jgi:sugar lactone lactonase YvrE